MSITRIQQQHLANNKQGQLFSGNLSLPPTPGNCLLMYTGARQSLPGIGVTQGGSGSVWTQLASTNIGLNYIYIFALPNIQNGSTTTINLSCSSNITTGFCSLIEEVSGLGTQNILDQIQYNAGIASTFYINSTSQTTQSYEYWVNIYKWNDPNATGHWGGTPSNNYIIFGGPNTTYNSLKTGTGGWNSGGSVISAIDTNGLFMTYYIATSVGVAGNSYVTDLNYNSGIGSASYNAIALTFFGQMITYGGLSKRKKYILGIL